MKNGVLLQFSVIDRTTELGEVTARIVISQEQAVAIAKSRAGTDSGIDVQAFVDTWAAEHVGDILESAGYARDDFTVI